MRLNRDRIAQGGEAMRKDRKQGEGEQGHKTITSIKYLWQAHPSGPYRVRLRLADGTLRYKRFDTELDAHAFMGRIIDQWERDGSNGKG